jgi:hypothetical protein
MKPSLQDIWIQAQVTDADVDPDTATNADIATVI